MASQCTKASRRSGQVTVPVRCWMDTTKATSVTTLAVANAGSTTLSASRRVIREAPRASLPAHVVDGHVITVCHHGEALGRPPGEVHLAVHHAGAVEAVVDLCVIDAVPAQQREHRAARARLAVTAP